MAPSAILVLGLVWSWGVLRAVLWLFPGLFSPEFFPLLFANLLSLWLVGTWMAPYRDGGFDFRSWGKESWTILLFMTGLLTGAAAFFSTPLPFFWTLLFGAFWPLLMFRVMPLIKQPLPHFYVFPKYLRFLFLGLWMMLAFYNFYQFRGLPS